MDTLASLMTKSRPDAAMASAGPPAPRAGLSTASLAGIDQAASFEAFGEAASKVLASNFHDYLLRAAASLVPHDLLSMIRYSRIAAPDFIACQGLSPAFVTLYNRELYRYDPYYRYWKEGGRPGVQPMSRVLEPKQRDRYVSAILAEANITDEVSILLQPIGGCCLALFIDRCGGKFGKKEIARLEAVYPLIAGLQEAHVASLRSGMWSEDDDLSSTLPSARPMRILDRAGREVFQNRAWQVLKERESGNLSRAIAHMPKSGPGHAAMPDDVILHRAALPAGFGLAPGGWIEMVEPQGGSPRRPDQFAIPEMLATQLTPREIEIVQLILRGYPTTSIADKLGVSRGTIKNHRLRLYEKLDITSERELFLRCAG